MMRQDHFKTYTYSVIWSDEDEEFVGLCLEYPSLSFLHTDHNKALVGIQNLVKNILEGRL